MKKTTKSKVRSAVKKGVVGTRVVAGRALALSKKALGKVKKHVPSQKQIGKSSRTAARAVAVQVGIAGGRAKVTGKKISSFSKELVRNIKLGIEDANKSR